MLEFWIQRVFFPLISAGVGVMVLYGVYRTVNGFLERRHERQIAALSGSARGDIQHLAERLEAMEEQIARIGELEERLDFAERLLAREREADRLKGPKG